MVTTGSSEPFQVLCPLSPQASGILPAGGFSPERAHVAGAAPSSCAPCSCDRSGRIVESPHISAVTKPYRAVAVGRPSPSPNHRKARLIVFVCHNDRLGSCCAPGRINDNLHISNAPGKPTAGSVTGAHRILTCRFQPTNLGKKSKRSSSGHPV